MVNANESDYCQKKDMEGTLDLLHKNKKKKADFDVEFSLWE